MRLHRIIQSVRLFVQSRVIFVLLSIPCALAIAVLLVPIATAGSQYDPAVKVTVVVDGSEWEYVSCQETVGGILREAGVEIGVKDCVYPKLNAKPSEGLRIRVARVMDRIIVQKEPIKFRTLVKFNPYGAGGQTVIRQGQPGEKEVKYLATYKDGVKAGQKVLAARVTKRPINEVVSLSRCTFLASRDGLRLRAIQMIATAYDPGPRSCGKWASGRTACGMRAGKGVVAVDPRFIRLGTKLYVDGYGFCVAGDTGGAIKGNRIDLGFNTYSEAIRFGRRVVTVYILE